MTTYRIRAADGWTLGVGEIPAVGERRGTLLLLHAMMVDARTLDRPAGGGLASTLAACGFDVHVADLRGRGASGPMARDGGRWTYDDIALRDVPALVDAVRDRSNGPLYLVGHSLGGHAALAAAGVGAHTIAPDGHVLLASNLWMPSLEGSRRRRVAKGLGIAAFRSITQVFGRFPSRVLRVGSVDEAASYVDDLCRTWEVDRWEGADGGHDYLASMSYIDGPVLAVVGAGDRLLAHSEGARAFVEHLGPGRAEFWRVGAGDHGLSFAPGHMGIVTDPRCEPLWRSIAAWVSARIAERAI